MAPLLAGQRKLVTLRADQERGQGSPRQATTASPSIFLPCQQSINPGLSVVSRLIAGSAGLTYKSWLRRPSRQNSPTPYVHIQDTDFEICIPVFHESTRTTEGGSTMRNRVAEFVLKIPGDPFGVIKMAV